MKQKLFKVVIILSVVVSLGLLTSQTLAIDIDGQTSDWKGVAPLGTDGDDMDNDDVDLKATYATNDDNLYLRLDVYGNINEVGNIYLVYLDTDQNSSTGFTAGWWTTGADYRIYLDQWKMGLQIFMGSSQTDDTWGWDGMPYAFKTINLAHNSSTIEYAVPRADISETAAAEATNILFRAWPGDDSIPYYNAAPLTYNYGQPQGVRGELEIDDFEYVTDAELNAVYSVECDPMTSLALSSDSTFYYMGAHSAKLTYMLGSLWSSVKMVRYFPVAEDWSQEKTLTLWVKGYSGCTENLLIYIIEGDYDEWAYQSKFALINDAWTKVIVPAADLWDNPWDGNLGDGNKTLAEVIGYKVVIQDVSDDGLSPVNKSVCVDAFRRDDGAISNPHIILDIDNYVCYYGASRVEDLSKFDLIIISAGNYTPEEIAQIKAKGAIVLGYVSLGEDIRALQVEDGTGPISCGVLAFKGYASYYLDDNPKDDYPDRNSVWGGYYVNAGNALWQDYVIGSLMNDVINVKGCDGVFLDTIDIAEMSCYLWTKAGVVSMIAAARKAYPDKYIASNRGFGIFADVEEYVNAEMFESFTSTYGWDTETYKKWDETSLDYTANVANQINAIRGYPDKTTVNALSLDYCEPNNVSLYTEDYNRAESFGLTPSVSDIYLSKIYMVNPANNFNAARAKVRKKDVVNLTWAALPEYVSDSNVRYFVIKRSTVGPINTEEQWNNAYLLSGTISPSARSFTDSQPPLTAVYYTLGAIKDGGMELIGRAGASCSAK